MKKKNIESSLIPWVKELRIRAKLYTRMMFLGKCGNGFLNQPLREFCRDWSLTCKLLGPRQFYCGAPLERVGHGREELLVNGARKMGSTDPEGRASCCLVGVNGGIGGGTCQGCRLSRDLETSSSQEHSGWWETQVGPEGRCSVSLRSGMWSCVLGLGVIPWRSSTKKLLLKEHVRHPLRIFWMPEVSLNLRRGRLSLPGAIVKNTANKIQV